ncbi:MAG: hypothetical protein ACTSU5_07125, partial [Promethearchaeota archaeon]
AADEAVPAFVRGLVQEAVRLAKSYARGLFVHGRHRLPRHNNEHEGSFHLLKGGYRRNSPNMVAGPTLGLTGPEEGFIPGDLTVDEIEAIIDWVGTPEHRQARAGMATRSARRAFKRRCREEVAAVLREIFAQLEEG